MAKPPSNLERVAHPPRRRDRRARIRWLKRILLGLIVLAVGSAIVIAMLPERVAVDTAIVARGPLEVEIREVGQTRVRERFAIAAPITGELERVALEPGSRVTPGMVVARIQPVTVALLDARARGELTARLAAARARERQAAEAIARARFARELAVRDANRARTLAIAGAATGSERERAELAEQLATVDLASAELQRAVATADIDSLRATLAPPPARARALEVLSPAGGRVLRVGRESAGPVAMGTPLLEVGDPDALEVVIDVLSRDAEDVRTGMPVELITRAPAPLRGAVQTIEPSAFTRLSALGVEEQRVRVIASIDAPARSLGDGYRVDARIVTWRSPDVLRAPASALFRDQGRWSVFVIEDQRARLRQVEVGHRGRLDVEIVRGLTPGARIIVHPTDRVREGVTVEPR